MSGRWPKAKQLDDVSPTDEDTDESLQPSKGRNRGVSDDDDDSLTFRFDVDSGIDWNDIEDALSMNYMGADWSAPIDTHGLETQEDESFLQKAERAKEQIEQHEEESYLGYRPERAREVNATADELFALDEDDEDESILDEAADIIEGRSATHGEPEDSFSAIVDYWNTYLKHEGKLYEELDEEDGAELLALFKLARSHNGEHNRDDRRDRAGYIDLAERQHES